MYSTTRIDRNDAKHAANKIMVEVLNIMAILGFIGVQREGNELKKKNIEFPIGFQRISLGYLRLVCY